MKYITFLLLLVITGSAYSQTVRPGRRLTSQERASLIELREKIREWAPKCPLGGPDPTGGYSLYANCTQGDVVAYAGMTCLAAVLAGDDATADVVCQDVAESQDSHGRWHRGPMWVDKDYPGGDFSRDQARGALAYQLAYGYISQDPDHQAEAQEAAEMWLEHLTGDGKGRLCPDSDTACGMGMGINSLFRNVWRRTGTLPPYPDGNTWADDWVKAIHRSRAYLPWGLRAIIPTLRFETMRGKWYPLNLKAWQILILRACNIDPKNGYRKIDQKFARGLGSSMKALMKLDPDNIFYRFMVNGITDRVIEELMEKLSPVNPEPVAGMHDWWYQRKWNRRDPNTNLMPWEMSDGWCDIFFIDLILAHDDGRFNW